MILGLAIIYSWLFTRDATFPAYLFKAGLSIPAFLLFLGFVRWIAIQPRTMKLGEYLCSIEESLAGRQMGWERFMAVDRKQRPFIGQFEGWSEFIVWGTLVVISLAVLIYVPAPVANSPVQPSLSNLRPHLGPVKRGYRPG